MRDGEDLYLRHLGQIVVVQSVELTGNVVVGEVYVPDATEVLAEVVRQRLDDAVVRDGASPRILNIHIYIYAYVRIHVSSAIYIHTFICLELSLYIHTTC